MNKHEQTMTFEQVAGMETRLSIETDALVSTVLGNQEAEKFVDQLQSFMITKNNDITSMCNEHSQTISAGIQSAKILGQDSIQMQNRIVNVSHKIDTDLAAYEENLKSAVSVREKISEIDSKIAALTESLIIIQQLKNINAEIEEGNYAVAVSLVLDFADLDTRVSAVGTFQKLQGEVDQILKSIEAKAKLNVRNWLINFREICEDLGRNYLVNDVYPSNDLTPLYEYYMVKSRLGSLDEFIQYYTETRTKQLEQLRSNIPKTNHTNEEQIDALFSIVAGFFITESRVANDGFNIIPLHDLESIWTKNLQYMQTLFNTTTSLNSNNIDIMIKIASLIKRFSEKMAPCSFKCELLETFLAEKARLFTMGTSKAYLAKIREVTMKECQELMVVKNPEDFEKVGKYRLAPCPTDYPTTMNFASCVPISCSLIEEALQKCLDFDLSRGQMAQEMFTKLVLGFCKALTDASEAMPSVPICGFLFASTNTFSLSMTYFSKFLQSHSQNMKLIDVDQLRKKIDQTAKAITDHLSKILDNFVEQMIDVSCLRQMEKGNPPNNFVDDLMNFIDMNTGSIQNLLIKNSYQKIIESIARKIVSRFISVIKDNTSLNWNEQKVNAMTINLQTIKKWATIASIPQARLALEGITKLFVMIQSGTITLIFSDPQFMEKNKDMPFDLLYAIISIYQPDKKLNANNIEAIKTVLAKKYPNARVQSNVHS